MRVYTRTGDSGETSLSGGTRVPKDHIRLEAYGTADELNSHIGLILATISDEDQQKRLTRIQNRLFVVTSSLALDKPEWQEKLPEIRDEDIADLEYAMDQMLDKLPELKNFILPGGTAAAAQCHIARTVCRRTERRMISLSREVAVAPVLIRYVNRLSDYLFVLARKLAHDSAAGEISWTSDFRDREPE